MGYLIAKTVRPKGACWLGSIQNVPEREDLRFGVSYFKRWPDKVQFSMEEEFPKDIALVDALRNVSSLLVVSARFKEALEAIPGALHSNEVLPVKIINHKKRAEKAPYFLIHQVGHSPCLDEAKCEGKRSSLDPKEFQFLKKMVLDESKIDSRLMLFRPAQYNKLPLIREDLVEKLKALDLTGIEFHEIKGYAF
jgi:hypothetical protein